MSNYQFKMMPVEPCSDPVCDGYTSMPTKLRIVRQGDDECPWVLDAWDPQTGHYSVEVWTFETFGQCVASIPDFVATVRRDVA